MRAVENFLRKNYTVWFKYFILWTVLIIVSSAKISLSLNDSQTEKLKFFKPVIHNLLKSGVDSAFIYRIILDDRTQFDEKYTDITVYRNPSAKRDYTKPNPKSRYAQNYNSYSVKKSKEFLQEYYPQLKKAEKIHGVPKEVITSILWVETRHGSYLGNSHVISVYLSLAMAGQKEYFEKNRDNLHKRYNSYKDEFPELDTKLEQKTAEKTNWAIDQIKALEVMDSISPIDVMDLRGSWAGAFGLSQFIPSSYVSWAVDGNGDGKINLFDPEDAIFSVANYLKINGWGKTVKEQRDAVFHYNHSNDYVDSVLLLADKLKDEEDK